MHQRWAPVAAAAAVVAVVAGTALAVSWGDERERDAALTPRVAASSTAPQPSAEPSPEAPSEAPTPDEPSPAAAPASPAGSPTSEGATAPPAPPAPPAGASAAPRPQPSPSPSSAPREAFSFDTAYGTDEPGEVVVQYGDSSSCPHENVSHTVEETAERVVVRLESDPMYDGPCTADYRQVLVPVKLAQPLGDRVVVDASRGEPVPVDRSCSRPFANPPPPRDCTG